jgi:hypothetical protein
MNVAGNDDGVGNLAVVNVLQKPLAIGRIAVPIVGRKRIDAIVLDANLRHQHILRDQIPPRFAVRESGIKPSLLTKPHHGAPGLEPLGTAGIGFEM